MRDRGDKDAPVAVKVLRGDSGEIELVRTSNGGTTVYFDSPEDALRRLNTWASQPDAARDATDLEVAPTSLHEQVVSLANAANVSRLEIENRRSESRLHPSDVSWFRGARSMYGAQINVVDISWNGVLIETEHELAPGATIAFELLRKDGALRVAGRVLRSRRLAGSDIGRFNGSDIVWYEAGCRFNGRLELESFVPKLVGSTDTHVRVPELRLANPASRLR